MPQMAPMLWLNLFIMFLVVFVLFIVMNYYIMIPKEVETSQKDLKASDKIWKW